MTADDGLDPRDGAAAAPPPISLRRLRREDFALLSVWFQRPHVERWWREPHDLDAIEARYGPTIDGVDRSEIYIVLLEGTPVGLIQWYCMRDNPDWLHALADAHVSEDAAGVDYLLGDEALLGRGLGPRVLSHLLDELLPRYPAITSIALSVAQENRRSWRMLEKLGFERVWSGDITSSDPSDEGPSYVYVRQVR